MTRFRPQADLLRDIADDHPWPFSFEASRDGSDDSVLSRLLVTAICESVPAEAQAILVVGASGIVVDVISHYRPCSQVVVLSGEGDLLNVRLSKSVCASFNRPIFVRCGSTPFSAIPAISRVAFDAVFINEDFEFCAYMHLLNEFVRLYPDAAICGDNWVSCTNNLAIQIAQERAGYQVDVWFNHFWSIRRPQVVERRRRRTPR